MGAKGYLVVRRVGATGVVELELAKLVPVPRAYLTNLVLMGQLPIRLAALFQAPATLRSVTFSWNWKSGY
jgi:hypothetical protein